MNAEPEQNAERADRERHEQRWVGREVAAQDEHTPPTTIHEHRGESEPIARRSHVGRLRNQNSRLSSALRDLRFDPREEHVHLGPR